MHRNFDHKKFNNVYKSLIEHGQWNEIPKYYSIYKKRYRTLIELYSQIKSNDKKQKILDIGGGQYALLCERIWQDDAFLADITDSNFNNLNSMGVHTIKWNLAEEDLELKEKFDVIFFSEVIEHLPIPGHIVLKKLKQLIKPGGYLICTTPNLYRIRNVFFLMTGKPIFDYFRFSDNSMGHMLEYSKDHIEWQLSKAGYKEFKVEYKELHNSRTKLSHRLAAWIGSPLYLIPRFRTNLLILAKNTDENQDTF